MRNTLRIRIGLVVVCTVIAWRSAGEQWDRDPALNDYFTGARAIQIPPTPLEKKFPASENQANITFFHGVDSPAVVGGQLSFTVNADLAILGWGNYMGRQPLSDIRSLWDEQNEVVIRAKASGGTSRWQLKFWADGKALQNPPKPVELTGTDWTEVRFKGSAYPTPDGFELTITGAEGTQLQIESITAVQPRHEGYVRMEFELPDGKVWQAVADAGSANERVWFMRNRIASVLYLNGERVVRRIGKGLYGTLSVDISRYLRPGRNCVAFYGSRVGYSPFVFLKATVIMASGEAIAVNTDATWRHSPKAAAGWNTPGFDDSTWKPVKCRQGVWYSHQHRVPSHHGLIALRNPYRRDLFYANTQDVLINVIIPRGLRKKSPSVEYRIGRASIDGLDTPLTTGTTSFFEESGPSLIYRLNLGPHERGVYTIALRLHGSDGDLMAERSREPFIVLRKKPLRTVEGRDIRDGLDLELERVVDFTDPADPHPWAEAKIVNPERGTAKVEEPMIVRRNGLVYREVAGRKRSSWFSYRLGEFEHPGDFYLCELEYPDDTARVIEVHISTRNEQVWTNSQAGVGAETGGKFFNTGKMQKLHWIHVADSGVHTVDVINVRDGWPAAAKSLKLYHVRGDLVSVGSGSGRSYGIHTERCYLTSGIGMNFGVDILTMIGERKRREKQGKQRSLMREFITDLVWMEQTSDNTMQYLKFSGQNLHLMGCIQYSEYNTPFLPNELTDSPRINRCLRTVLANVLDMNGIDFLAGIEFSGSADLRSFANNAQVAKGADTIWMVNGKGEQFQGITRVTVVPNWQHPGFAERYHLALDTVVETFGGLRHFRGVSNYFGATQRSNYYMPAYGVMNDWDKPLELSYDDITFANFQGDTGLDIPIAKTDPQRFEKRASLVRSPRMRQKFLDWRCRKLRDFYATSVAGMRAHRDDLEFVNILTVESADCFKQMVESGRTFDEMMKDFAIDIGLLGRIPGLSVARWTISWRQDRFRSPQNPYSWIPKESEDVIRAFSTQPRRAVLCRTSWDENVQITPGCIFRREKLGSRLDGSDWRMDAVRTRALPQPGGSNAREAMIQAIITSDPQLLLHGFTDLNVDVGHEQARRSVMRLFTRLPEDNFESVLETGLRTNLAIRKLSRGDESWLYVANPGYWHARGMVTIISGGDVVEIGTGKMVASAGQSGLEINLQPFGFTAYRVPSKTLEVASYRISPITEAELAHMTRIVDRVEELAADPEIGLVLTPDDREFARDLIARVRAQLAAREYANAWSLVKDCRFWTFWQEFLEKAAAGLALLPKSVEVADGPSDPQAIRSITATRVTGNVAIDGKLAEPDWGKAAFSGMFRNASDKKPALNQTAVRVLFDERALYIAFVCADRETGRIQAGATKEKELFSAKDDALAIFLQPDEKATVYYQMAFNPKAVQFDQKVKGGDRDYDFHPEWNVAISVEDDCWIAEVELPYAAFGLEARGNTGWRMNFFRIMRDCMLPAGEWSLTRGNWHAPEYFGRVSFGE